MNIYVETNFVLELTFEQEQAASCNKILNLCKSRKVNLIIPSFSLTEPLEKLHRQSQNRDNLQKELNHEINQLKRNPIYKSRLQPIQDIRSLLIQSNREERIKFEKCRELFFEFTYIIPLSVEILKQAAMYEKSPYNLRPQDAIVYASIIASIKESSSIESCFLNRNSRDFDLPEIVEELENLNCKMIPRFDDVYNFISNKIKI